MGADNTNRVVRFDVPPTRSVRVRRLNFMAWLGVMACVAAWPLSLAAEEAKDACKLLDEWVAKVGLKQLVNEPSPFHAELSSQTLPGRGAAWVMFEDPRLANIKDADASKLCVKAYARPLTDKQEVVTIKQAFLDTVTKGDNKKRLKVVFQVPEAPSDLYSGVPFLFVGALADTTPPTYFSYFKEVTVANNRTTTFLSWLFVIIVYLFLARITYNSDAAGQSGTERFAYALSPIRITASWFGEASLAQAQVFLFTFIVAGMLFYFWLSSGVLSEISKDSLFLLGISAVGAGGAKFTQTMKTELNRETARYLIGKGWYDWPMLPVRECATLRNLLLTDGRLDVYKFQMAIFTVVVACYVLSSSQTSLGDVKISETMLYLMGISQGVYVGGKAVTDRTTDLENAVKKMMELDNQIVPLAAADPKRASLAEEYKKAATFAVGEFASLYNRAYPRTPRRPTRSGRIR